MINNEFPVWLEEAKDLSSTRSKWDWIKFNIRTSSIAYSVTITLDRQKDTLTNSRSNSTYLFKIRDVISRLQKSGF